MELWAPNNRPIFRGYTVESTCTRRLWRLDLPGTWAPELTSGAIDEATGTVPADRPYLIALKGPWSAMAIAYYRQGHTFTRRALQVLQPERDFFSRGGRAWRSMTRAEQCYACELAKNRARAL